MPTDPHTPTYTRTHTSPLPLTRSVGLSTVLVQRTTMVLLTIGQGETIIARHALNLLNTPATWPLENAYPPPVSLTLQSAEPLDPDAYTVRWG